MGKIYKRQLDADTLLARYATGHNYTDCYTTSVSGHVDLAKYIGAFYTTWLFRIERVLLKWAVKRPSSDAQACELAAGEREQFAAWDVEARSEREILLCDLAGSTRSWLMVAPQNDNTTMLYFGSAVIARDRAPGPLYRALLGFHKLYSRALLSAARRRIVCNA